MPNRNGRTQYTGVQTQAQQYAALTQEPICIGHIIVLQFTGKFKEIQNIIDHMFNFNKSCGDF